MANHLTVEIVTPVASVFSGEAREVVIPAWEGQLGVLPDHDALLTLLKSGQAEVTTASGTQKWVVGRGFADIGGDHVTLLTDQAIPLDEINKEEASSLASQAQADMDQGQIGTEAYKAAQARLEWAQALLDA